jgi:hypothetical protein
VLDSTYFVVPSDSAPHPDLHRTVLTRAIAFFLFAAAIVVVPTVVPDADAAGLMPDAVALVFIFFLPTIFTRRRDLFAPPIYFGILGATGAIAMTLYLAEVGPMGVLFAGADREAQIGLVRSVIWSFGLGSLAYQIGFYLAPRPGLARRFPDVAGRVWQPRRLYPVLGVVGLVALVAYTAFQLKLGVPIYEVTRLREARAVISEGPNETWMQRGIELGFLPGLFLIAHTLRRPWRWQSLVLPAAALSIMAILVFRISLRGSAALALVFSTIVVHCMWRRLRIVTFIALYLVGIAFANIALEWRRIGGTDAELTLESLLVSPVQTLSRHEEERGRLAAATVVMSYFPEQHDFLYGESYLAFLVAPIPRALYPEKRQFTEWADNRIPFRIAGILAPAALQTVLYANFSWIGILVGMFLYGMFHRGLYDWFQRHPRDPNVVLLYGAIMLFFSPTLLGISASLQWILPIYLLIRVVGTRSGASIERP